MQIEIEQSCILLLIDAPSIHVLSAFSRGISTQKQEKMPMSFKN